jgi:hypothetical protein
MVFDELSLERITFYIKKKIFYLILGNYRSEKDRRYVA